MPFEVAGFGSADLARGSSNAPLSPSPSATFRLRANQDPGLLSRIVEPLAKRGLVPAVLEARCRGMPPDQMLVVMQLDGVDRHLRNVIAATLEAIIGVSTVTVDGPAR